MAMAMTAHKGAETSSPSEATIRSNIRLIMPIMRPARRPPTA